MNRKAEHHIRSFGMSGLLIAEELKQLEDRFNMRLGHIEDDGGGDDEQSRFYPQFEEAVRIEASSMSQHYELFYC